MAIPDLHILPKVRDSWTYLYAERCRIDQEGNAIALHDEAGKTPVPCATLSAIMLGPGTTITHAAIRTLADSGCLVLWTGEEGVRFYAEGQGETRSARNLIRQARLASIPDLRMQVVRRMYTRRFREPVDPALTLQQVRGMEGVRAREAYARASRETGVPWHGRSYQRTSWGKADPVNRALSAANSCLYGVCHSAIVAAGYSPGLGFIHTGKLRSFVFDIADLYKSEVTIPAAFEVAASGEENIESRVRHRLRDYFRQRRVLPSIIDDIDWVLRVDEHAGGGRDGEDLDTDLALPGGLWDPEVGSVSGGINYGNDESDDEPNDGSDRWS